MLRSFSRKPWFARSLDLNKKVQLRLLRLETREAPSDTLSALLGAGGLTSTTPRLAADESALRFLAAQPMSWDAPQPISALPEQSKSEAG